MKVLCAIFLLVLIGIAYGQLYGWNRGYGIRSIGYGYPSYGNLNSGIYGRTYYPNYGYYGTGLGYGYGLSLYG